MSNIDCQQSMKLNAFLLLLLGILAGCAAGGTAWILTSDFFIVLLAMIVPLLLIACAINFLFEARP